MLMFIIHLYLLGVTYYMGHYVPLDWNVDPWVPQRDAEEHGSQEHYDNGR